MPGPNNLKKEISIIVFANSKDFFLTKLCVASIRHYYPVIKIYMVKDILNGKFSTKYFEKIFNIKTIQLPKKYLGWGAGKVHILKYNKLEEGRYLILDSDIIFLGNVIDKLASNTNDFIVHGERYDQPFSKTVKQVFLDPEKIITLYPEYEYPGFFFNTGQFLARLNAIPQELITPGFDENKYSYFLRRDLFHLPDQALLNTVFPVAAKNKQITMDEMEFMLLSEDFFSNPENNNPFLYKDGNKFPFLVHYTGLIRTINLQKMHGSQVLLFFKKMYEEKLNRAQIIYSRMQDYIYSLNWFTRLFFIKNRILMKLFNIN